jgi:REP element-mobilizing transposase RayT
LRIEHPGGWFHVTGRGNEQRAIYRDNRDREHFCELLSETVARFRVRLHAFVLMDNHYHLIIELTESNLSRAIQWLNVSYSVWFNRRHQRSGHLFQGRFKSVVVDPSQWGLALSRYVHLNPARVDRLGLGKIQRRQARDGVSTKPDPDLVRERILQLRQYRWSSYPAYAGFGKCPEWLEREAILRLGGAGQDQSTHRYRQYVEQAAREGLEESPWEHLTEQVVLGTKEFVSSLRKHAGGNAREQSGSRRLSVARPTLEEVIAAVEPVKQEKWTAFRDRYGDSGRDLVLYLGRRGCGLKLRELADYAGMDYSAVSTAIRVFEKRLQASEPGQKQLQQACKYSNIKM